MPISIDPADSRPIYVQIKDEVRRAIVLRRIGADEPLPAVRQLAVELRVNPNTVSQAYRELENEGVVEVRRGQGTFVVQTRFSAKQRRELAHDVAERALRDAYRSGLDADDLVEAIRVAGSRHARQTARA